MNHDQKCKENDKGFVMPDKTSSTKRLVISVLAVTAAAAIVVMELRKNIDENIIFY